MPLSEQDVLYEALPDQIGAVQIDADDDAGDEDDDDALDQLALTGPLDFLELAPRLAHEVLAAASRDVTLADLRARLRRPGGRLDAATLKRNLSATVALRAPGAALRTRLSRHYRVSLCGVWRPHQRQYFLNSTRSGEFRFDFCVW
jgi:hypothetical protein